MYLLVVTVSVFVLASVVSERRAGARTPPARQRCWPRCSASRRSPAAWVTLAADRYPVIREANPAFLDLVGLSGRRGAWRATVVAAHPDGPGRRRSTSTPAATCRPSGRDGSVRWLRPDPVAPVPRPRPRPCPGREPRARGVRRPGAGGRHRRPRLGGAAAPAGTSRQPHRPAQPGRPRRAAGGGPRRRLEDAPAGLLILDIDDLKVVNNGLGHLVGDQLIIQMGQRFAGRPGPRDLLVRTGGDEFAVLRPRAGAGATPSTTSRQRLLAVGRRAVRARQPAGVGLGQHRRGRVRRVDARCPATCCVGRTSPFSAPSTAGAARSARFEPGEDKPALERMGIEELLRRSLDNDSAGVPVPADRARSRRPGRGRRDARAAARRVGRPRAAVGVPAARRRARTARHADRPGAAPGLRGSGAVAGGRARDPGRLQRAAAVAQRGRDRHRRARRSPSSASPRRS